MFPQSKSQVHVASLVSLTKCLNNNPTGHKFFPKIEKEITQFIL